MANFKTPNNSYKFYCEKCHFGCYKNSDYNRHLMTSKHNIANNANNITPHYSCNICKRIFKHSSSLSRHKKQCNTVQIKDEANLVEVLIKENTDFKNVMLELVKSNTDLQQKMLEMCSTNHFSTINNTINNSHNKTFNMHFFLNEQCKDAMNIMDFVDTFKLQFSDLERVGEVGYVEGISNIIIKRLNEMDIYKRPIHCSDAKRETLYVKDNNIWEKENGNHNKLRLAIKHITKKNTDLLNPWCLKHPGSCDSDNYLNDVYLEMVMQAMGGRGLMEENENKIIKKIAKTVIIDK